MQYRRISADCHLDLPWLPPDLFTSQASRELKDRMPFVEDGADGPRWVTKAGVFMGIPGAVGSVGAPFVPGQNYRVDKMAETGLYEAGKRAARRIAPGDPHLRIKEMEKDGVDAEIIFGILGVASRLEDHEAANEMLRIYNDWLRHFCSFYRDRQIGLACLPYGDIEAAAKEVYRVAKLGLRGLELSCSWDTWTRCGTRAGSRYGRRSTTSSCRCISHTFPQMPQRVRNQLPANLKRQAQFTTVAGFQMNLIQVIIAAIIGAGVLERYPNLRDRFWRERHRLAALRARPHGFRVRGPLPRPDEDEAERILAPAMPRHVPVRPHRAEADRRDRPRNADVGLGLSALRTAYGRNPPNTSRNNSPASPPTRSTRSTCENAAKFYGLIN